MREMLSVAAMSDSLSHGLTTKACRVPLVALSVTEREAARQLTPSPEPPVFLEGASGVCPICNGAEG